ncbi:hypothetical protein Bca4012_057673 [Brassica carinata]
MMGVDMLPIDLRRRSSRPLSMFTALAPLNHPSSVTGQGPAINCRFWSDEDYLIFGKSNCRVFKLPSLTMASFTMLADLKAGRCSTRLSFEKLIQWYNSIGVVLEIKKPLVSCVFIQKKTIMSYSVVSWVCTAWSNGSKYHGKDIATLSLFGCDMLLDWVEQEAQVARCRSMSEAERYLGRKRK